MDRKRLARILILTALLVVAFYLLVKAKTTTALAAEKPSEEIPPLVPEPSLKLEGRLNLPDCFATYDKVTEGEERVVFSISTGTKTSVLQNLRDNDIEVLEILVECVVANTFQITKSGLALTPIWDFAARQTYSDPGFVLRKGEEIFIIPTSATAVIGFVRFRERGTAVCATPITTLSITK